MKKWLKKNAISILIGVAIGCLAGYGHLKSARDWQQQKAEMAQEAREYEEEVKAEHLRWKQMELVAQATVEIEEEVKIYDPDIPEKIQEAAWKYGEEYNICPEFLMAVAWRESGYDPEAVNGGCKGLMQVSVYWHKDRMERLGVSEEDIWTVDGNMHVAADYLAELFETYEDNGAVLMAYNGDSRLENYLNGGQMSGYAQDVITLTQELEQKHFESNNNRKVTTQYISAIREVK